MAKLEAVSQSTATYPMEPVYTQTQQTERQKFLKKPRILLYGPSNVGKTFAALSLSKHFKLGPCRLDDVFHAGIDDNALAGAAERGIEIEDSFDCTQWLSALGYKEIKSDDNIPLTTVRTVTEMVAEMVKRAYQAVANGKTILIFDTLSALDKMFLDHAQIIDPRTDKGKKNGWARYELKLSMHRRFYQLLAGLEATIVFCAHSAPAKDAETESGRTEQKARRLFGDFDIKVDITGQGENIYINNIPLQLAVVGEVDPKTRAVTRCFYTDNAEGWQGKNKFGLSVPSRYEPADLGALMQQIRHYNAVA